MLQKALRFNFIYYPINNKNNKITFGSVLNRTDRIFLGLSLVLRQNLLYFSSIRLENMNCKIYYKFRATPYYNGSYSKILFIFFSTHSLAADTVLKRVTF